MDYDKAVDIFKESKLFYAEPVFIGSYDECINYPNKFQTSIPAKLGLPPLPAENFAEGVVIKPLKTLYINSKKGNKIRQEIINFKEKKFVP